MTSARSGGVSRDAARPGGQKRAVMAAGCRRCGGTLSSNFSYRYKQKRGPDWRGGGEGCGNAFFLLWSCLLCRWSPPQRQCRRPGQALHYRAQIPGHHHGRAACRLQMSEQSHTNGPPRGIIVLRLVLDRVGSIVPIYNSYQCFVCVSDRKILPSLWIIIARVLVEIFVRRVPKQSRVTKNDRYDWVYCVVHDLHGILYAGA